MNKTDCDIIKDLLPLYEDNICSEKSKDLIEEHLIECEDCREYLDSLHEKLPPIEPSSEDAVIDETRFIKRIQRKIARQKLLACGILLLTVLAFCTIWDNTLIGEGIQKLPLFDKRIASDYIEPTQLYRLKDGRIFCTLKSEKPFSISSYWIDVSPKYYDQPCDDGKTILSLERSRWEEFWSSSASFTEMSYVLPLKEEVDSAASIDEENQTVIHYSTSIYYEGKKGERKLIWKEGQKIKDAPLSVEKRVAAEESGKPNEDYGPEENVLIFDFRE